MALGAAAFVAHATLAPADSGMVIEANAATRAHLEQELRKALGREPTTGELAQSLQEWLGDEALFQEALSQGFQHNDAVIRRQAIANLEAAQNFSIAKTEPTDEQLHAYLKAQPSERYAQLERFDFEHIPLGHGEEAQKRAEALTRELPARSITRTSGDPALAIQARSSSYLAGTFGKVFARRTARLPLGQWSTVKAEGGWYAVRLGRKRGGTRNFEQLRPTLRLDWQETQRAKARRALAERALLKYDVPKSTSD